MHLDSVTKRSGSKGESGYIVAAYAGMFEKEAARSIVRWAMTALLRFKNPTGFKPESVEKKLPQPATPTHTDLPKCCVDKLSVQKDACEKWDGHNFASPVASNGHITAIPPEWEIRTDWRTSIMYSSPELGNPPAVLLCVCEVEKTGAETKAAPSEESTKSPLSKGSR